MNTFRIIGGVAPNSAIALILRGDIYHGHNSSTPQKIHGQAGADEMLTC